MVALDHTHMSCCMYIYLVYVPLFCVRASNVDEDMKVLLHIHIQAASSEDISRGSSLFPTLGGEFVTLTKKEKDNNETVITAASSLGEATVIKADVEAENSVIHVIDSLL